MSDLARITSLVVSDSGEFRVTPVMMANMQYEMYDAVNAVIDRLLELNPDYQFNIEDDIISGDRVIRWRRRKGATTKT